MEFRPQRRTVLKSAVALGAAQFTHGIGAALAQQKSIAATTFPGAWEEAHRLILLPAFRSATGAQAAKSARVP